MSKIKIKIKTEECSTYEGFLTVGSVRGYGGEGVSKDMLLREVSNFQKAFKKVNSYGCSVRVIDSQIIYCDYLENCYDLCVINYPRFPLTESQIDTFLLQLAQYLLKSLGQERITVVKPGNSVMYEREDADTSSVH
jgi:hypothetical protein